MTPRRVRAGIIGPNGIGRVHADALRRIGVEVAAVSASSDERAQHHARQLEVDRWYGNPYDLIGSADIDVVHICTPNYLHAELARRALEAGKHVVCEKPLATSLQDGIDLVAMAEAGGLVHAVCYGYRYYPMVRTLRRWIADGRLGRVHLVHGTYLAEELLVSPSAWMLDPRQSGPWRTLADVGIHWFDLLEFLTARRIEAVAATLNAARESSSSPPAHVPADDSDAVLMRLNDGTAALAAISQTAPGHGNAVCIELNGTLASARWEQEDPDHLWFAAAGQAPNLVQRAATDGAVFEAATLQLPAGHPQGFADAFRDLMAAIYARVRDLDGQGDYPTFADGLRSLRVLTALSAAAYEGTWAVVEPGGEPATVRINDSTFRAV